MEVPLILNERQHQPVCLLILDKRQHKPFCQLSALVDVIAAAQRNLLGLRLGLVLELGLGLRMVV